MADVNADRGEWFIIHCGSSCLVLFSLHKVLKNNNEPVQLGTKDIIHVCVSSNYYDQTGVNLIRLFAFHIKITSL